MKIIKQIMYQKELIDVINKGTEQEEIISLIPEDRVIIRYIEGDEEVLTFNGVLKETTDIEEPNILIKKSEMSTGNPKGYDLSMVGSKELLEALLLNIENKLNV